VMVAVRHKVGFDQMASPVPEIIDGSLWTIFAKVLLQHKETVTTGSFSCLRVAIDLRSKTTAEL
jgi:hypothetical protein